MKYASFFFERTALLFVLIFVEERDAEHYVRMRITEPLCK